MEQEILEKLDEISDKVNTLMQNANDDGMIYMIGSQILQKLDEIKRAVADG